MTEFDNDYFDTPEEENIDELLASAKAELGEDESLTQPDEIPDEPEQVQELPAEQEPQEPAEEEFEPDFGNAFDDYGDYADERQPHSEPTRETEKKKHLKRVRFPVTVKILIYLAIVAVIGVACATVGWRMADDVLALTRPDEEVVVEIDASDSVDDITRKLVDAGAVKYDWLFKLYVKFSKSENYFDPGVYTINLTYDYHALVNNLMASAGNRESVKIMIIEGASCKEIYSLLEENDVCQQSALEKAAANYKFDYAFLKKVPYGETNRLEGFLFPDTYEFYLNDEPQNVIAKMLDNFEDKMDEELMAMVDESSYTLREVITMASIVEGEAANDEERPKIASVVFNRLNNWELPYLNMDSTVYYAAERENTAFSLELDSPYNTYMYAGLPAGPINNPGIKSIRAVLYPTQTDYYYFATATDGLNRFFSDESSFTNFLNSEEFKPISTGD